MKRALIVRGGWEGHDPVGIARVFGKILEDQCFEVAVSETLDVFSDKDYLQRFWVVVPIWTMGRIADDQIQGLMAAVAAGVGLAGCHGGMCDAFRDCVPWHFMTGGQWVAHPGNDGVHYSVHIKRGSSPITRPRM